MGRYGLRADQWERIAHLLPGKDGDVGVTAKDNKLFVDAVLYRYRAGIPWRYGMHTSLCGKESTRKNFAEARLKYMI
nr:transposase [Acidiphilium sp. AL]